MGTTYIPVKTILEELDIDVVLPPMSSKKTLELGIKCSPEAICVPFKIIMGNILEGIENGADTVFMLTGCGPCRFGIFHALQNEIIRDMNLKIEFITADRFSNLAGLKEFSARLKEASPKNNYLKIFNTIRKGLKILDAVDELQELTNKIRPIEINTGEVDYLDTNFSHEIRKVHGYDEAMNLIIDYKEKVSSVKIDKTKQLLKIGIVGEIYTILEPFINLNIEKKLGVLGIDVARSISASEYVREQLDFLPFVHSGKKTIYQAAKPYLEIPIGGHAINTIGNSMLYKKQNFDGIIHLLPFTCMPEIVAQCILPTIEKEQDIPIMTLVLDEMTGEAGYMTRLEAFVDLLVKRKDLKNEGNSLSWN